MSTWKDFNIKSFTKDTKAKPYDKREPNGDGFGVTIFPSGKVSFIYFYHFNGRKRRMTIGKYDPMRLSEARAIHDEARKILSSGKDPALEKKRQTLEDRNALNVSALIDEYIEQWAKPRKKSWQEDYRILHKDIMPAWGKLKAADVTKRDIMLMIEGIVKRGAPITANRTLSCIKRMFNFAVERDILQGSPCVTVKALSKENRRERYLSADELHEFWHGLENASMSERTKIALKLQLVTAQRKGEIVAARWDEIDFTIGVWTIPASKVKNGKSHRIPLSKLAIELLSQLKILGTTSQWLFPASSTAKQHSHITGESVDHALRRSKAAFPNVTDFSPHTLRATATTHMASMRISSDLISRILNHSKRGVTEQHYNKYEYEDEKRHALESWSSMLYSIIYKKESENNVIQLKTVG